MPLTASATPVRLSEKLPDISEYDGDRDKLNAWEHALIQRMHVNHDQYPTDAAKIAYAESRLTIGKRASILMMPYWKDGICTIFTFTEYRWILRHVCGNPFEAEDTRTYLWNTLKQGSMSFVKYYQLFCQKKDRSGMKEASLIDCFKRNVTYTVQQQLISYRNPDGTKPITFQDHVNAYLNIDNGIQQLHHQQLKFTITLTASGKLKSSQSSSAPVLKPAITVPVVSVTPAVAAVAGDPMDLNSAMAVISGKSLSVPGVRDICNKWNLCFYCKKKHLSKNAKECLNKKSLSSLRVVDLDDNLSTDDGVSVKV